MRLPNERTQALLNALLPLPHHCLKQGDSEKAYTLQLIQAVLLIAERLSLKTSD